MNYTIKNDKITAQISDKGAELMSVIKDGVEYIWQGNPEYWSGRAYNLFPTCWCVVKLTSFKSNSFTQTFCKYILSFHINKLIFK